MKKHFLRLLKKENRILLLILIGFFLLFLSAIIFPFFQNYIDKNWETFIESRITKTNEAIQNYFTDIQKKLIERNQAVRKKIINSFNNSELTSFEIQNAFFKILLDEKITDFSFLIFNKEMETVAWSYYEFPSGKFLPLENDNDFNIIKSNFKTFLAYTSKFEIENDVFYLTTLKELESNYYIKNEFIKNISLNDFFSEKFDLKISIIWDTVYFSLKSEIINLNSNTIKSIKFLNNKTAFYISIQKPDKDLYLDDLLTDFGNIQKIIFLFILFTLIYSIFRDIRIIESRLLQACAISILIWLYRVVLLLLNFPAFLIDGDITNPSIYASRFLYGLVKSPLELFLSASTLALNLLVIFVLYRTHLLEKRDEERIIPLKLKLIYASIGIIFVFLTPFVLRGFGATFRSYVFDSTLKFFEQPSLLPNLVYVLMYYSIFITGISLVLFLVVVIYFYDRTLQLFKVVQMKERFFFIIVLLVLPALIFYYLDKTPQFDIISINFLLIIVSLIAITSINEKSILTFRTIFLILISASFFSSIFIYQKNLEQEKGLQQTIAYELLKPREQLINFALNQTLQQIGTDEDFSKFFFIESSSEFNSTDFNLIAYRLWINSILSDEGLNSYLFLFDKYGKQLGSFGFGMDEPDYIKEYFDSRLVQNLTIFLVRSQTPNDLFGVIPIKMNNLIIGYCGIVIELSQSNFQPTITNALFKNIKYEKNPFILVPDAVVYVYKDNQLNLLKGNDLPEVRNLDIKNIKKFLEMNQNEFWMNELIGEQKFRTFYFVYDTTEPLKIISVSVPEKKLIVVVFNLFKVTLVHIIISTLILLIGTILLFAKGYKFKLKFKTKLFFGLFVVTLIPIILLAYFTRESELQRWKENLSKDLKKDLDITTIYFNQNVNPSKYKSNDYRILMNHLGIDFNIYKNSTLIFSTQKKLYEIEFFPRTLPAKVFNELILERKNYTFDFEFISNFPYLVGYKKIENNDSTYIFSIPTLYRQEKIQAELAQIDTFIFGAYSLTLLLIFIFGNLFFEKLTKPISELTEATKKVSSGDLTVKLEPNESGEVGDLIEAFNKMISDLDESRKNLARIEREQAWKEMAKQVAHEIKNPLTPMKLSLQHLQFLYKENRKEFAKIFGKVSTTLIEQIEALTKITNEFSHFARMPERKIVKCNLEKILKEVIDLFSSQIKINYEFVKNELYLVNADKEELKRVFINLIKNSIQANSSEIKIKLFKDANYCFINIEDNGTGIPEEMLDKIFDPNFSTKTEGTGLGLPIVKRILNDLNGNIEIKSEVGKGTVVMISIPLIKEIK